MYPNKMNKVVVNAPQVAYRWPRTLNDLFVGALICPPEHSVYEGSCQCGRYCCKICANIRTGTDFTSPATGHKFSARLSANYKTSNIIYLMQCHKCKMQYVGETENPLHSRMNGQRSDYYCRLPDKPVAKHFFNTPGYAFEDVTVMVTVDQEIFVLNIFCV